MLITISAASSMMKDFNYNCYPHLTDAGTILYSAFNS